ncbi:hypothetical protein D3C78_1930200 [compost metagenome]
MKPMMALSGVRSSWLILAKNWSLSLFEAWAWAVSMASSSLRMFSSRFWASNWFLRVRISSKRRFSSMAMLL